MRVRHYVKLVAADPDILCFSQILRCAMPSIFGSGGSLRTSGAEERTCGNSQASASSPEPVSRGTGACPERAGLRRGVSSLVRRGKTERPRMGGNAWCHALLKIRFYVGKTNPGRERQCYHYEILMAFNLFVLTFDQLEATLLNRGFPG